MSQTPPLSPAEMYEDFLVRWQFRPWAAVLLSEASLLAGERVLDLAAGTGIVAREAAPFVGPSGRVVALDVNPAMLEVGRKLPAPAGATIEWQEANATSLDLPDAAFDVVLCQQGLQYIPDKPAALKEARRVLAPGGRGVFAGWTSLAENPVVAALNEAVVQHFGSGLLAGPFDQGDPEALGALLTDAGFTNVTHSVRKLAIVFPSRAQWVSRGIASMIPLLPELASMDEDKRTQATMEVGKTAETALADFAWGSGLAAPMTATLMTARA